MCTTEILGLTWWLMSAAIVAALVMLVVLVVELHRASRVRTESSYAAYRRGIRDGLETSERGFS